MKAIKYLCCLVLFLFIQISCTNREVLRYKEIAAEDLNSELRKNLSSYKAIYYFDPTCGQCKKYLMEEYPQIQAKYGDSAIFYFIFSNQVYKSHIKEYLKAFNVHKGTILYLKNDVNSKIIRKEKLNLNAVFKNCYDTSYKIDFIGTPMSAMLDKKNRLKIQKIYYTRRDSVYYRPMPWHDIKEESFETEHFGIISDSVVYLKMFRQEQIN